MIFENVTQGSTDWINLRRRYVTAKDISVILGVCHFKTMSQLYDEKIGLIEPEKPTEKMLKGQQLEPLALDLFNSMFKLDCKSAVVISEQYPFLMASLDGISSDNNKIVEIKCSDYYYRTCKDNQIPESIKCQMQTQMLVTGLNICQYFCYWKGDISSRIIIRDQNFIDEIIPKAYEFWKCVQNLELPQGYNEDRFVRNEIKMA